MEAKLVIKITITILIIFLTNDIIYAQNKSDKYLFFNSAKDSLILKNKIKYYKIYGNMFDTKRFNQVDTISSKKYKNIKFTTVQNLNKEGNNIIDKMIEKERKEKTGKIRIIESYNQIFEYIYIIEKITDCSYKRTRVWWIDY
ncbi:hypothetical protein [Mariniflexile maritimum]|uniref:hypothetical protein n=1 Tax=Mariniflexile maritimum TaxID=2682493 RepID=UPI0018DD70D0|nr:hypothetical protein [Mariniflexile maritimum]